MAKKDVRVADTNVWVRYLVGDNQSQRVQARVWLTKAEAGKFELQLHPIIVAEACYVMESVYNISRQKIAEDWQVILSQKWLKVINREELLSLWLWYLSGFHFIDSYLLAWNARLKIQVLSFDKKMNRKLQVS